MDKYEILVVDDVLSSAKGYSEYIELKTKIKTIYAVNAFDALEIIRQNHIKIVVLDQRMPGCTGTELYKQINKIAPDIKAIMFSGEASIDEVGEACSKLHYGRYVHKSKIKELPNEILDVYAEYELDLVKKNKKEPLSQSSWSTILSLKRYFLISYEKHNNDYIFPNSWEELDSINEGEEKETTTIFKYESKITHEASISGKQSYIFKDLFNKLNIQLDSKYSKKQEKKQEYILSEKFTRKFDSQDIDSDSNKTISKSYDIAKVYDEYRVIIEEKCLFCDNTKIIALNVYKQNRTYSTRTTYHYSNNKPKIINTGIHKLKEE